MTKAKTKETKRIARKETKRIARKLTDISLETDIEFREWSMDDKEFKKWVDYLKK